jgi:hypothetical protein
MMNDTAKALYDRAIRYLDNADEIEDSTSCMCYTAMGQLALDAARFALDNHALVRGIDEDSVPVGVSPEPTGGPKLWGTP